MVIIAVYPWRQALMIGGFGMKLEKDVRGTATVITVAEERIDAAVAIQFKDQMREVAAAEPARVVLDLGRVDFIDSSGLGAIVAAMKMISVSGRLELAGLTPTVEKVFRLTRMDSVFKIFDDAEQAFRATHAS